MMHFAIKTLNIKRKSMSCKRRLASTQVEQKVLTRKERNWGIS
eukprot:jgi/Antlo1/410/898